MVSNYGYGIIWDNPSKTTVEPGFNERTLWSSEVGDRVSFFVIAGETTDEIYSGYRQLYRRDADVTKIAYGYIQCKQRYSTTGRTVAVAQGYRAAASAGRRPRDRLVPRHQDGAVGFYA